MIISATSCLSKQNLIHCSDHCLYSNQLILHLFLLGLASQEKTSFPKKQATTAVAAGHKGYSIGYAKEGFGPEPHQDHTSDFKRCMSYSIFAVCLSTTKMTDSTRV